MFQDELTAKLKFLRQQFKNNSMNENFIDEIDKLFPLVNQTTRALPDHCTIRSSLKLLAGELATVFQKCQEEQKTPGFIEAARAYMDKGGDKECSQLGVKLQEGMGLKVERQEDQDLLASLMSRTADKCLCADSDDWRPAAGIKVAIARSEYFGVNEDVNVAVGLSGAVYGRQLHEALQAFFPFRNDTKTRLEADV